MRQIYYFCICLLLALPMVSAIRGSIRRSHHSPMRFNEQRLQRSSDSYYFLAPQPTKMPNLKKSPRMVDHRADHFFGRDPLCYFTSLPCHDYYKMDANKMFIKH